MKHVRVRLLSLLLAAVMLASLLPVTAAAEDAPAVTGSISATVRIDYAQTLDELARRDLRAVLKKDGGSSLGFVALTKETATTLSGGYTAVVSLRNGDGAPLDGGKWPGYLDVTFGGLPQGSYTLTFEGTGYKPYTTGTIEVQDYARQVTVGTGDATFTLGDVDGDKQVTEADRAKISAALGTSNKADIAQCDLNGDGKVDIIDLSYINRQLKAQGDAEYLETALLGNPVKADDTEAALKAAKTTASGELNNLFTEEGNAVTFTSENDSNIVIPLVLTNPVEVSELEIVTPVGSGEVEKGTITVETQGGETIEVPFDHTLPAGIHAVGRIAGSSVVTINLGKRVAVKKVTITVIKTGDEYATVETIRFLKDIVPENPTPPNSTIKGLAAKAGHEQVALTWQTLPNVSGYTVHYWPQSDSSKVKELRTTVNSATVTGLENLIEYAFTVTPTDGSWTGKASQPVYAVPQPAKVPAAPDMVNVGVLDSALTVSWKKSENATFYKVFYQVKGASTWTQAGGTLTGTGITINDLTNDTTYSIYIIAGNALGESGKSRIAEGTPKGMEDKRPEGIPEAGLLSYDKIASMELVDKGNYDSASYSASRPWNSKNMWDDNYTTHWTASSNWSRNEHVVTTFKEPVDLTAAFWVPRLEGNYPRYLRAYSVRIWYEGEELNSAGHLIVPDPEKGGVDNGGTGRDVDTWPNVANYSSCAADRFAVLPFGPVENVVKVSIAVEQYDYETVSLSELLFMEYDPAHSLPADIDALFVGSQDGLHTELVSGVTQETIDALRTRLNSEEGKYYLRTAMLDDELALAESLLKKETPKILLTGIDSRDGGSDSAKYSQGGSVLQPIGAAAGALSEVTIYAAGIPEGETVTLHASQYNAEANTWLAKVGEIQNGRNVFTVPKIGSQDTPRGGSLYVTYSGNGPEDISLHVRRATDIPLLDLSDWYTMTETQRSDAIRAYVEELTAYTPAANASTAQTNWQNVTEIATPTVLLSLPASAALAGLGNADTDGKVRQLTNSVLAWEDLLHICKTTQGIDNTYEKNDMETRQNIRCMQMFTGAFMYAAGSHIGIGFGSCSGMVGGTPIKDLPTGATANNLFGWGIAHEIGHNMDKLGKAEITNNIYSIMVQTFDGKQNTLSSRLEKSNKYPSIFTKTAQATPGASGDVFTQLGMYWQLHLAYDSGEKPMDFYNRFFKAWKAGTYTKDMGSSYDDKVALTAAGVAGKDLTEFFTRWGMALSPQTKDQLASYDKEDRAVWYLSDQSRRDRLEGTKTLTGSFTASAALTAGTTNKVTLTIDGSGLTGSLQGYEILRNGQSIDFVVPESGSKSAVYTDLIGSANHRVFNYAVVAYSTLGTALTVGESTQVGAGSIRIAYDAVLDSSTYSSTREGDTVTITLHNETAVSGLKLTGAVAEGGAYTVTITDGKDKETVAKDSTFDPALNEAHDDMDCYLLYFNKPMTTAEDSRIWTYDAKTIVITGVGEGVTVLPISYAGDDVAFMADGAVGRLDADYDLGDGKKITAGTIVITGTYRGDPLYNFVEVKGRFATAPDEKGENQVVERTLSGDCYLFAELPADGEVSDISNGIFIFVPNLKAEEALQGVSNCGAESLLPGQMMLEFYRTNKPNDASSKRKTAETMWLTTPGGDALPTIVLEGEV